MVMRCDAIRLRLLSVSLLLFCCARPLAAGDLPARLRQRLSPCASRSFAKNYTNATVEGTCDRFFAQTNKSLNAPSCCGFPGRGFLHRRHTTAQKGLGAEIGGTRSIWPRRRLAANISPPGSEMFDTISRRLLRSPLAHRRRLPDQLRLRFNNRESILEMLLSSNVKVTSFKKGKKSGETMFQMERTSSRPTRTAGKGPGSASC